MNQIKIERNNKLVVIKPNYDTKGISLTVDGKELTRNGRLNREKKQFLAVSKKVGVQLNKNQFETVEFWLSEFRELRKKEDQEKIKSIQDKKCEKLSFKFHHYLTQRFVNTESILLSDGSYTYSDDSKRLMGALNQLSHEQLAEIGIRTEDDIWQDVIITDEVRTFIDNCITERTKEINEKIAKDQEKKQKAKKEAELSLKDKMRIAEETKEKQIIGNSSFIGDDGNLVICTKYVLPNGIIKTDCFHDTD
jgi:hypothetical protein